MIARLKGIFRKPRLPARQHWYVHEDNTLVLFGQEAVRSPVGWEVRVLASLITRFEASGDQRVTRVVVRHHVASDLWLGGELTKRHLHTAIETPRGVIIPNFVLGHHVVELKISHSCDYMNYEFITR